MKTCAMCGEKYNKELDKCPYCGCTNSLQIVFYTIPQNSYILVNPH